MQFIYFPKFFLNFFFGGGVGETKKNENCAVSYKEKKKGYGFTEGG